MRYMVFDIESIGLHGEGFAFAYVVIDENEGIIDEHWAACPTEAADGEAGDRDWVAKNIPALPSCCETTKELRDTFWKAWDIWRRCGCLLVTDCGWPVEHRFLAACVDDKPSRKWDGPYPMHELASFMHAKGEDPQWTERERREDEKPEHHPLSDARQSARLLAKALWG